MSTCLRCGDPIDPGATRTTGLLCAPCAATIDEIRTLASFRSRVDPTNPRCQVVEIRRRRPADETTPDYHVTGDATSAALAHFCVYFLTSLGVLPEDIAEAITEDLGPPPPAVVDASAAPPPVPAPPVAPPAVTIPPLVATPPTTTLPPAPSAGKPKPRKEPRIALVTSAMGDRVATMPDDVEDEEPVS